MSVYYSCVRFVDVIQSCRQQWSVVFSWVLLFASLTEINTFDKKKKIGFLILTRKCLVTSRKIVKKMKIQLSRVPDDDLPQINCVTIKFTKTQV